MYCKKKWTKKAKHFTVIGLTNLLGENIYHILTIDGKEELFDIRAGIGFYKEKVGDESYGEEWFHMNFISDKYHPGGLNCTYKGGKYNCLVKFY